MRRRWYGRPHSPDVWHDSSDRGCRSPEGLVVGEDPALDAIRFYRSDGGVVLTRRVRT